MPTKLSTVLDHIDSGHMALPEFQRGYVWNRDQVRGLFDSLYRRHPVGGLLVWATESPSATHRGDGPLAAGVVKLLLDGQQPITSLLKWYQPPNLGKIAARRGVLPGVSSPVIAH